MKNVRHWLPPHINCAYQVFNLVEYEEIVHAGGVWPSLPVSLNDASNARKASFYAGRACAAQALANAGMTTSTPLARAADGLPVWPAGWVGSISHALQGQTGVAIAVAAQTLDARAIAIDCEPVFDRDHALEIAPLITSANERLLGERLEYSHALWMTMVYSLKETLYKLLYEHVRCFMPFEAAELLSFDAVSGQACLMLSTAWGDLPAGQRYWLQVRVVTVDAIGDCVLSFGLERA